MNNRSVFAPRTRAASSLEKMPTLMEFFQKVRMSISSGGMSLNKLMVEMPRARLETSLTPSSDTAWGTESMRSAKA